MHPNQCRRGTPAHVHKEHLSLHWRDEKGTEAREFKGEDGPYGREVGSQAGLGTWNPQKQPQGQSQACPSPGSSDPENPKIKTNPRQNQDLIGMKSREETAAPHTPSCPSPVTDLLDLMAELLSPEGHEEHALLDDLSLRQGRSGGWCMWVCDSGQTSGSANSVTVPLSGSLHLLDKLGHSLQSRLPRVPCG